MDPETAKLVVPGLFALAGVIVGGIVSFAVARANLQGQRQVALDNARREFRSRQVQPLRERINTSLAVFQPLGQVRSLPDFDAALIRVRAAHNDESGLWSGYWVVLTENGLTDKDIVQALLSFLDAENQSVDEVTREMKSLSEQVKSTTQRMESIANQIDPDERSQLVQQITSDIRDIPGGFSHIAVGIMQRVFVAADELNHAIDAYAFGDGKPGTKRAVQLRLPLPRWPRAAT